MATEDPKKQHDTVSDETKSSVLRVHHYDPTSESVSQKRIIQLKSYDDLKDKKLNALRPLLVKEGVFDSPE